VKVYCFKYSRHRHSNLWRVIVNCIRYEI